jgi:hypothetical protein
MAASPYLASALITSAKRRGLLVTSDETWSAADFYAVMDEETRSVLLPLIKNINEEHLVRTYDVAVEAGVSRYRLPWRCGGEALKYVKLVADGDSDSAPLSRVEPEHAHRGGAGFYLEDDFVVLTSAPTGGALRVAYYYRPNRLVAPEDAAQVLYLNAPTGAVTVTLANGTNGIPEDFTSDARFDLIRGRPGFRTLAMDLEAIVESNTITFAPEDIPAELEVGDFIALAEETPVPQVPLEAHPYLAALACFAMESGLSPSRAQAREKTLEKMERSLRTLLAARTQNSPRYVHNFAAPGWNRGRGRLR